MLIHLSTLTETFANLLLLYVKYQHYDLAADVLAENAHLTVKYLTQVWRSSASFACCDVNSVWQYLYDFLEAVITQQTSPEDAFDKFELMFACNRYSGVILIQFV